MKPKHRRLLIIAISLVLAGIGIAFILRTLNDKIVFFYNPSEITDALRQDPRNFRVGGLVEKGSLQQSPDKQSHAFIITDNKAQIFIKYRGLLPDLFREGQGVIAEGKFDQHGVFIAHEVLAKHDEKYIPPAGPSKAKYKSTRLGRGEQLKVEGL